jgi:hypothetical protein
MGETGGRGRGRGGKVKIADLKREALVDTHKRSLRRNLYNWIVHLRVIVQNLAYCNYYYFTVYIKGSVADPGDFCPDPDPTFQIS